MVSAAMNGQARTIATRTAAGVPETRRRAGTGMMGSDRAERHGLEQLFDEGGDVVAPPVQDGANELHADAIEAAAETLDLGDAGAVCFDDDEGCVEPRRQDRGVDVQVGGRQVEDDELELRPQLVEG